MSSTTSATASNPYNQEMQTFQDATNKSSYVTYSYGSIEKEAKDDFQNLNLAKKVLIVALSILVGMLTATVLTAFTFKALVHALSKSASKADSTASKADSTASKADLSLRDILNNNKANMTLVQMHENQETRKEVDNHGSATTNSDPEVETIPQEPEDDEVTDLGSGKTSPLNGSNETLNYDITD